MNLPTHDASARQHSGEPSSHFGRGSNRTSRPRRADKAEVDRQIAQLFDWSTHELCLAWRQLHRTGPPQGLSRDLLIRALANQLQEQTHGGTSRMLRRRLQTLAGKFEKGGPSFDPGIVLKTGTTLVRQWRGHANTVLVHQNGDQHDRLRRPDITEVERQIAGLANRSTQELRVAWRQLHHTGPPLGLSRDLLIRALANQLQEQSYGSASRALRRRLWSLARASEKTTMAVDPGLVLKAGTTLVRQWRGHTHTVLVHNDGFEHQGQLYRSLTAIAERITEAHWSGPRFFGLTKRARAVAGATAGR